MAIPTYTQEELLDRYEKLPQALKDAIFAETNADKMFNLGKKNGLTIDQTGEAASETGHVMLGVTHPRDFVNNLKERLHVDSEKARGIAEDINREIFRPIREHLKDLHKITDLEISETQALEPITEKEPEKIIVYPKTPQQPIEEPPPPPDIPIQEEALRPETPIRIRPMPSETEEEKKWEGKGRAPMIFPQKIEEVHKETKEEVELPPEKEQETQEQKQEQPTKELVLPIHKIEVKKEESIYKGQDPYRELVE
mgnify:CR=1 FL=1